MGINLFSVVKTVTKKITPDITKRGKKLFGETVSLFEKSGNAVTRSNPTHHEGSIFSEAKHAVTKPSFKPEPTNYEMKTGKKSSEKGFWGSITEKVTSFIPEKIKKTVKKGKEIVNNVVNTVKDAECNKDTSILDNVKTGAKNLADKYICKPFSKVKKTVTDFCFGKNSPVKRVFNSICSVKDKIINKTKEIAGTIYDGISKTAKNIINKVKKGFNYITKPIKTVVKNIASKVKSGIKKVSEIFKSKNDKAENVAKSTKEVKNATTKEAVEKTVTQKSEAQTKNRASLNTKSTTSEKNITSTNATKSTEQTNNNNFGLKDVEEKVETKTTNSTVTNPLMTKTDIDNKKSQISEVAQKQDSKSLKSQDFSKSQVLKTNKVNFKAYQAQYGSSAFAKCAKENGAIKTVVAVLNDSEASDVNINMAIKWLVANPQKQTDVIMNLKSDNLSKALKVVNKGTLEKLKTKTLSNAYATRLKEEQVEEVEKKTYSFVA